MRKAIGINPINNPKPAHISEEKWSMDSCLSPCWPQPLETTSPTTTAMKYARTQKRVASSVRTMRLTSVANVWPRLSPARTIKAPKWSVWDRTRSLWEDKRSGKLGKGTMERPPNRRCQLQQPRCRVLVQISNPDVPKIGWLSQWLR